jgi:tetrahydromethanopterin S-methyltransferase subunit G
MEVKTLNELALMLQNHIDNENERHNTFDEKLDGITDRLDYTNGNVKDLLLWRSFILGGLAILTALVIPMAIMIINAWLGH